MNTAPITIAQRIEMARTYHAEGRIIQHSWRKEKDGHELVCALAAFGPDINGTEQCPAELMPHWMAALVPSIDDGIAPDQVLWFSGALIDRASRWYALDDAAWERIRTGFMIASIKQALEAATPVQPSPAPNYWQPVVDACNGLTAALEEGGDLKNAADAAYAAADAAYAAAYAAADAAADAAYAAADAAADAAYAAYAAYAAKAADAAADAAYAAADAAADAAYAAKAAAYAAYAAYAAKAADAAADAAYAAKAAAYAAYAAKAAAWKSIAETLFRLIDIEIDHCLAEMADA